MHVFTTVSEIRRYSRECRCSGERVGLVPTMGALHAGHLALVDEARQRAGAVVVSIFVNPTQFGPGEDFGRYPRTLEQDLKLLENRGVDAAFVPGVEEMYPAAAEQPDGVRLRVGELGQTLCGQFRPGHFDGVVQIVAKLFTAVEPDVSVFGLKDAQQFVIIKNLVAVLGLGIEIVGCETVREPDGLAMSSRNGYLNSDERARSRVLSEAIDAARERIEKGELAGEALVTAMLSALGRGTAVRVQYAEVVDARSLQRVEQLIPGQKVVVAVAAYVGSTRLIDSAFVTAPV